MFIEKAEVILMKKIKNGKVALFCAVIFFFAGMPAFSQDPLEVTTEDLTDALNVFADNMARSLPFNAAMGLNWSDAFIGQLVPSPPRFGVGFSVGFTTIESAPLGDLLSNFDFDIPINIGGFPLPGYTIEGRIGGFFLPFDIGIKFGYLPVTIESVELELDYLSFGVDIRYALLRGNESQPRISIGAGFNFLRGGISRAIDRDINFFWTGDGNRQKLLTLDDPRASVQWQTANLDLTAQISKSFVIFTPFAGIGASHGWSSAGYQLRAGVSGDIEDARGILEDFGVYDLSEIGFSSMREFEKWNVRAFGGFSLNLAALRLNFTGMYDFFGGNFGFVFGARIQL